MGDCTITHVVNLLAIESDLPGHSVIPLRACDHCMLLVYIQQSPIVRNTYYYSIGMLHNSGQECILFGITLRSASL
jgi:hypothetical protein